MIKSRSLRFPSCALFLIILAANSSAENLKAEISPLISIPRINSQKPLPGLYRVRGYIKFMHTMADCPVCPPGAVCEACQKPYVLVNEVDENPLGSDGKILNSALVIYIRGASDLKVGHRYEFFIAVPEEFQVFTGESSRAFASNVEMSSAQDLKE